MNKEIHHKTNFKQRKIDLSVIQATEARLNCKRKMNNMFTKFGYDLRKSLKIKHKILRKINESAS